MIVSSDVAALAICRIFLKQDPAGSAPLSAQSLYRQWETTGLRRDDLAAGIKSLTEVGCLRAEHRSGNCHYFLVRSPGLRGARSKGLDQMQPTAAEAILTHASNRLRAAGLVRNLGRRNEDKDPAVPTQDGRKAQRSRLLMALPNADRVELERHLELVPMPLGVVLWGPGDKLRYVYFPIDCIVSLVHDMQDGASSEMAIIGNEGMVDASVLLGSDTAPRRALVVRAGYAYRIPVEVLRQAFDSGGAVQRLLLMYFRALLAQIAQTGACNRHHSVEQQLCRFLLSTVDRIRTNKLAVTHEMIASSLGVRREGVTEAIGRLKKAQLISCERSVVVVLDRGGLERRSCECYAAIRHEYEALRPAAKKVPLFKTAVRIVPEKKECA